MSAHAQSAHVSSAGTFWDVAEETSAVFSVSRDLMPADSAFETHAHQEDQLAWLASGSMALEVGGEVWSIGSEHIVWIPAGTMHAMRFPEDADIVSLYLDPTAGSLDRREGPLALHADPLAGSLLRHLSEGVPTPRRRSMCRRLLWEVLRDAPVARDMVALPREPRARTVAARLVENPADERDLDAWAREIGVSTKTLARAFVHGTGSTFRDWRVNVRLHAAARRLAAGDPVADAAAAVGYVSPSAFIASFRRRFGVTPGRYAAERARVAASDG